MHSAKCGSFCEYRSTDDGKQNNSKHWRPNHKRSETIQIQCSPVLAEGPQNVLIIAKHAACNEHFRSAEHLKLLLCDLAFEWKRG